MKKLILSFILIFLALSVDKVFSQNVKELNKKSCFWFSVKIELLQNEENTQEVIRGNRIYKKISSGSFNKYSEIFKKKIKKKKIVIGPFSSKRYAKNAQNYFRLAKMADSEADEFIKHNSTNEAEMYYYFTKVRFNETSQNYQFERMPARITSGPNTDFMQLFHEGLPFKNLLIGPFNDYLNAEKSKFISRKNSEGDQKAESTNEEIEVLKEMATGWKKVNKEISIIDSLSTEIKKVYEIKIQYPPNYFDANIFQVMSYALQYNDSLVDLNSGQTLQGEGFTDNNPIIYFEKGGTITLKVTLSDNKNLKNIILKSTFFSNNQMFECGENVLELGGE